MRLSTYLFGDKIEHKTFLCDIRIAEIIIITPIINIYDTKPKRESYHHIWNYYEYEYFFVQYSSKLKITA